MVEQNKELVVQSETLREPMEMGDIFAQSGMFPDVKTKAQGAVKILAGRELGLSPFQAMKSLYMVSGRLAMMADVMASMIKKGGKYDYSVDKLEDKECILTFYRVNGDKQELGKSTFTFQDAAKAGLVNKDNWKNYPRNMLFSRALSNGVRWFCPDAVCGYYTVEEMQDTQMTSIPDTVEISAGGEVTTHGTA